jgi:hypothetical protein
MGEIKLTIINHERSITGVVHEHLARALVASLTAEPDTIPELEMALRRFMIWEAASPLAELTDGEDLTRAEDGLLAIDLVSRTVCTAFEELIDDDGIRAVWIETPVGEEEGFHLPFFLSDDWRLVSSVEEFAAIRPGRRAEREANPTIDYRVVMYGSPLVHFIATECVTIARPTTPPESIDDDPAVSIHKKWYMTPREDLGGKTPREVLFYKRRFIDRELQWRNHQWSFAGVCPPHIPTDTNAYRLSGFGIHEWVIYYYLVRYLIDHAISDEDRSANPATESSRLAVLQETYWNEPDPESYLRTPRGIVESERRRIGISMSAKEILIDENCPCCQMMAEDFTTPMFWHLDGCNMDEGFEFSYNETPEEYEKEQREWVEMSARIDAEKERKRQELGPDWFKIEMEENYRQFMAEHGGGELVDDGEDDVPF